MLRLLKDADGMANSVDPEQTAPLGVVWSGSALFSQTCLSKNLGSLWHLLNSFLVHFPVATSLVQFQNSLWPLSRQGLQCTILNSIKVILSQGVANALPFTILKSKYDYSGLFSSRSKPKPSDGDKDAYCVCTHGLLVGTHDNFKPNAYRVHIKI